MPRDYDIKCKDWNPAYKILRRRIRRFLVGAFQSVPSLSEEKASKIDWIVFSEGGFWGWFVSNPVQIGTTRFKTLGLPMKYLDCDGVGKVSIGSISSPVGPMHPATITMLLYPSAISLPVSAEIRVSSVVYFSAPCSLSADLLATNEFVRNRSLPASGLPRWWALILLCAVLFQRSGASPADRPTLKRFVPVAPSAQTHDLFFKTFSKPFG